MYDKTNVCHRVVLNEWMLIQQLSNRFSRTLIVSNQTIFLKISRSQFYNVRLHAFTPIFINILRINSAQRFHLFRSFLDRLSSCRIRRSVTPSYSLRYNLIHIYHISKRQKGKRVKIATIVNTNQSSIQIELATTSIQNESYSTVIKMYDRNLKN